MLTPNGFRGWSPVDAPHSYCQQLTQGADCWTVGESDSVQVSHGVVTIGSRGSLTVDGVSVIAVALTLIWVIQPPTAWLRDGTVYVSQDGTDWNLGATPQTAVRTLQRAADLVAPGERVVLLPGVYAGNVRVRRGGEPGRPLVFRAFEPGTVTITDAAPLGWDRSLVWNDEGDGIHSTTPPWPVYYLRQADTAMFHVSWGGLDNLRQFTQRPGAWPAFAYDREANRLFVYLPRKMHPSAVGLVVHRPIPSPREWGMLRAANVWVEAPYVSFEGLRFDFGVGANLLLWRTGDLRISGCTFEGARVGVAATPQVQVPLRVTIESSFYHNYPQYHWRRDWLEWREVYAHYSGSGLVALGGAGHVMRYNLVTHAGDALGLSPDVSGEAYGALVQGNVLMWGTDDAIEVDGQARDVRFLGNLVYDFHQNLGLSPVLQGPVVVEGNRFLHPSDGVNGSQMKLINPWYGKGGAGDAPIQNVRIQGNVFVGNRLMWSNGAPMRGIKVIRNVLAVQRRTTPEWPDGVEASENVVVALPEQGYPDPGSHQRWWSPKEALSISSFQVQRPSPHWLDWSSHPATREIVSRLPHAAWTSAAVSNSQRVGASP